MKPFSVYLYENYSFYKKCTDEDIDAQELQYITGYDPFLKNGHPKEYEIEKNKFNIFVHDKIRPPKNHKLYYYYNPEADSYFIYDESTDIHWIYK